MSKLKFDVPNYYHLAPRNYGKAKSEYPQVIDYLENEIHRLSIIIDTAINHLVECCYDKDFYPNELYPIDDLWGDDLEKLLKILKGE